jgi:hypothetical protein
MKPRAACGTTLANFLSIYKRPTLIKTSEFGWFIMLRVFLLFLAFNVPFLVEGCFITNCPQWQRATRKLHNMDRDGNVALR